MIDLLKHYPDTNNLQQRLIDWLHKGKFTDPARRQTNAVFLYCLMENWPQNASYVRDQILSEVTNRATGLLVDRELGPFFDTKFAEGYILLFLAISQASERMEKGRNPLDPSVQAIFRSAASSLRAHFGKQASALGRYSALNPLLGGLERLGENGILDGMEFSLSHCSAAHIVCEHAYEMRSSQLKLADEVASHERKAKSA